MTERENKKKRKLYFRFLYPMMNYLEEYGLSDGIGAALGHVLPQITNGENLGLIGAP